MTPGKKYGELNSQNRARAQKRWGWPKQTYCGYEWPEKEEWIQIIGKV